MNNISHDDYVNIKKKELIEIIKGILNDKVDIIAACRFIFLNWEQCGFSLDKDYGFFSHLDDEIEIFSPDTRKIFNINYFSNLSRDEEEFIKYYLILLKDACHNILSKC